MQEGEQWALYIPANLACPDARKRGLNGFEPLILIVELIPPVAANRRWFAVACASAAELPLPNASV